MKTTFLKSLLTISFFTFVWLFGNATTYPINVTFSGTQEVPANSSAGTGTLTGNYDDATNTLTYTINFSGLSANVTAAHFHSPAPPGISAAVAIAAAGFPTGATSGTYNSTATLTDGQEDTLKMGLWYFNIHTTALPGGEIRAQIFLQDAAFVLPDIHCIADTTVSADSGVCSASLAFAATDTTGKPTSTLYYRIGNTAITSPYTFSGGVTRVTATALNAAGFDTCVFNVTVTDTVAPVITCPSDTTLPNDPGQCGAIVNFSATATDNCSSVTVTYDHDPGSLFPVGTTTVIATATDSSGNASTCSFNITVNDVEPPVIHDLDASSHVLWPPNHKMKDVTVNYTSTDNCPGPIDCEMTVTTNEEQVQGSGNTSNDWVLINDHLIKLRAERAGKGFGRTYNIVVSCTDQYGNTGKDSITVFVPHDLRSALIRNLIFQDRKLAMHDGENDQPFATNNNRIIALNEEDENGATLIQVYPNPSRNYFTLNIETGNITDKISIRIIDVTGRVVEMRNNISGNQTLKVGNNLKAGLYIAEIRQGQDVKSIKLLRQE
ncbi:MAG: CHRD domain-containing protein, partial [Bacteroidota bacterium]